MRDVTLTYQRRRRPEFSADTRYREDLTAEAKQRGIALHVVDLPTPPLGHRWDPRLSVDVDGLTATTIEGADILTARVALDMYGDALAVGW